MWDLLAVARRVDNALVFAEGNAPFQHSLASSTEPNAPSGSTSSARRERLASISSTNPSTACSNRRPRAVKRTMVTRASSGARVTDWICNRVLAMKVTRSLRVRIAVTLLVGTAAGCTDGSASRAGTSAVAPTGASVDGGVGTVAGQGGSATGSGADAGPIGSTGGAAGSSVGSPGDLLGDEVYAGGCLDSLPQQTACDNEGRVCTYGSHPRTECRDRASCIDGTFVTQNAICEPAPDDPSHCPEQLPNGAPCTQDQQMCAYPDGSECLCMLSLEMWLCDVPQQSNNPACPPIVPNAGVQCPGGAGSCSYPCGLLSQYSVTASCDATGVWTWEQFPCATTN